ncbi:MAG: hypothetical protein IIY88_03300, partial [Eubacterium sp.]|nr:hypothetical protein [Eubacterium sp.]
MKGSNRIASCLAAGIVCLVLLFLFAASENVFAATGTMEEKDGVITLTNYKTDQPIQIAPETTIVLNGENEINLSQSSGDYCLVRSGGNYVEKLTIKGSGSLKTNGKLIPSNELEINGVKVTIDHPYAGSLSLDDTVMAANKITVSGAEVTVTTGNMAAMGFPDESVEVVIKDHSVVNLKTDLSSYSFLGGALTVQDSDLNVTMTSKGAELIEGSYICETVCFGSIKLKNADLKVKGVNVIFDSFYNHEIDHSSLVLECEDQKNPLVFINGENNLILKDASLVEPAGGKFVVSGYEDYVLADANGKAVTKVIIEADHKWDAGKVTKAPTMNATGVKTYTCAVCGKTKTEAIPKLSSQDNFKPGADASVAEACILALPNDNDPAGSHSDFSSSRLPRQQSL